MQKNPDRSLNRLPLLGLRVVWAATALLSLAAFIVSFQTRISQLNGVSLGLRYPLYEANLTGIFLIRYLAGLDIVMMSACAIIALVLAIKKFDDWMAIFVSLFLFVFGVTITRSLDSFIVLPADRIWLLFTTRTATIAGILLLLYLFPDGRFVPRWTRTLAIVWGIICIAWLVYPNTPLNLVYFDPNKQGGAAALIFFLAWMFTGFYAQIYRFLKVSSPAQRQQTKLVILGIIAAILGLVAFLLPAPYVRTLGWADPVRLYYVMAGVLALYAASLLIPLSITVSILRYRLWEIDVIIRRTLVYGSLTTVLALTYLTSVILLQGVIRTLTGGAGQSQFSIVLSTLVIAALFTPLRRRIQNGIDQRFYRRHYDIEQTLQVFANSLKEEVDLDQLSEHLLSVVQETMQPESVSLWMNVPRDSDFRSLADAERAPHPLETSEV
jgi:hypothetical protein